MTRLTAILATVFAALLVSAPGYAAVPTAHLTAAPTNYSGKCPATITFNGVIRYDATGRVQYKFIRSDNANAPVQTLNFAKPGSLRVHTTWTLGGAQLPTYTGWEAIQIIYPQQVTSNRAAFRVRCAEAAAPRPVITGYRHPGRCVAKGSAFSIIGHGFGTPGGKGVALGGHGIHVDLPYSAWSDTLIHATLPNDPRIQGGQWYYIGVEKSDHSQWLSNINRNITVCRDASQGRPDLRVRLSAPSTAAAGTDIGSQIKVVAYNSGSGTAAGTASAGNNGYMIDVMLSSDTHTPAGWASYSPNYHEDVLLQGGRISNTQDLAGGASKQYPTGGGIPADTPTGNYYICAKVDAGNKIAESNEGNNVACTRIRIAGKGQPGTADRKPDLVVRNLRLIKDCKIQVTIQNRGGPLPDSAYNPTQGAAVQMYNGTQPWGGLRLAGIDPTKKLKTPGASVSHIWFPGAANLQLTPGTHTIKVTVDNNNAVAESNEGNNTLTRRLTCRSTAAGRPAAPAAPAQAGAAVPRPLQVVYPTNSQNYRVVGNKLEITIRFNRPVNASTVNAGSFKVWTEKDPNAQGTLSFPNNTTVIWRSTKPYGDLLEFDPDGFFRVNLDGTGGDAIKDTGGHALDGDKNGSPGGDYSFQFVMLG